MILINNPDKNTIDNTEWNNIIDRNAILTRVDSTSISEKLTSIIPVLLKGSTLFIKGSLYYAEVDEVITEEESIVDGVVYIKAIKSIDGLTVSLVLTSDSFPAWNQEDNGWYIGEDRILKYYMVKSGVLYTNKGILLGEKGNSILTYSKKIISNAVISGNSSLGVVQTTGNVTMNNGISGSLLEADTNIIAPHLIKAGRRGTLIFSGDKTGAELNAFFKTLIPVGEGRYIRMRWGYDTTAYPPGIYRIYSIVSYVYVRDLGGTAGIVSYLLPSRQYLYDQDTDKFYKDIEVYA